MIAATVKAFVTPLGHVCVHRRPIPMFTQSRKRLFSSNVLSKNSAVIVHDELISQRHGVFLDDTEELPDFSSRDARPKLFLPSNSSSSVEQAINHHVLLRVALDTLYREVAEEPASLSLEVQHRLVSDLFATIVSVIAIVRAKVLTVRL